MASGARRHTGEGRRRPGPADVVRTVLALGAVLPGLFSGALLYALTRDRRRAVDRAIGSWGRLGTRAAGIRLEVAGGERLALRPAVFFFNHQSGVDPILMCALLERGFTGIAKQEIRRNPLLGPAFRFAGVVFIDRGDREQAVGALGEAVETVRSGVAVVIAPEGTRSRDGTLGPFKKGGFRLAMAAGVPIVPVVLHNARDVLPRGAWWMTPATVRVSVLAPIDTTAWQLETLDAHVAEVRERFSRALAEAQARANTLAAEEAG
jgi:1-acyl-sn-glycerol-3-phosphate acyltransferase